MNPSEMLIPVITTGSAGAAQGSEITAQVYGRLHAVDVKFNGAAPGTTTVLVEEVGGAGRVLLQLSAGNTSHTYYPTAPMDAVNGTELIFSTSNRIAQPFILAGRKVRVTVANSDALAPAVTVLLIMEG